MELIEETNRASWKLDINDTEYNAGIIRDASYSTRINWTNLFINFILLKHRGKRLKMTLTRLDRDRLPKKFSVIHHANASAFYFNPSPPKIWDQSTCRYMEAKRPTSKNISQPFTFVKLSICDHVYISWYLQRQPKQKNQRKKIAKSSCWKGHRLLTHDLLSSTILAGGVDGMVSDTDERTWGAMIVTDTYSGRWFFRFIILELLVEQPRMPSLSAWLSESGSALGSSLKTAELCSYLSCWSAVI